MKFKLGPTIEALAVVFTFQQMEQERGLSRPLHFNCSSVKILFGAGPV